MLEAQSNFDVAQSRLADTTSIYRASPSELTRTELLSAQGNFILAEIAFCKAWSSAGTNAGDWSRDKGCVDDA